MGADVGNQIVTIRFARPVDSDIVNKRFKDIRSLGIYKGGYLTITASPAVSLSPLVCEISDSASPHEHQVRVETTIAVIKSLTVAKPYLVLTWEYSGVEDTDYAVITTSSLPDAYDIIIGKGVFTGSTLTSIDYSERTTPSTHNLFLQVEEMETPSSIVRIRAGVAHGALAHSTIPDRTLAISGISTGETIYIYVTDSGGISYSKTPADYVGKALLAKIVWPSDGIIENSDIIDARSFITPPAIPDGGTIERGTDGKLKVKSGSIGYSFIKDVYDSGWFSCTIGGIYTKTHNLGSTALIVQVLFAPNLGGVPDENKIFIAPIIYTDSGQYNGVQVRITSTSFTVKGGNTYVYKGVWGTGFYQSGHFRILAMRIA